MNTIRIPLVARKITLLLLILMVMISLTMSASTQRREAGSFIIQGKDIEEVIQLIEAYGGRITSRLEIIHGVAAILPERALDPLRTRPEITAIYPNARVEIAGRRDRIPETDYPDVIGADIAWEQGVLGSGVTVAIVDTGLGDHQGIKRSIDGKKKNRIVGWVDFIEGSRHPRDPNGHGTHIAGIIANSQKGSDNEWNGIAPGVRLVGVRVLDEDGFGTYEQVIQGLQWVIDHKDVYNIRIINLSLVANVQSPYWADPLNQAVMQAWLQGITVVVAAGNSGPGAMTISVPGNNPYVITVGAFTDHYTPQDWSDDYLVPFSAAGPTLDGFVKPDLVAPGAHIVSAVPPHSEMAVAHPENRLPHHYFWIAGTSQAAAVASGVAALILSRHPDLAPDQVKFRLMHSAFPWVDLETDEALYSMWQQGAGRVNAPDAVLADIEGMANQGLDVLADLNGVSHFEGYCYYDETIGEFRLRGVFSDWTGGYGAWAGDYLAATGGYGAWAGGYGAWAGGYGAWAGGYGAWAGGYGAWAGGYGAWAGGYGAWAGGYGAWAGGYGAWAGSYGDSGFAERFTNWRDEFWNWSDAIPWTGGWNDFDG